MVKLFQNHLLRLRQFLSQLNAFQPRSESPRLQQMITTVERRYSSEEYRELEAKAEGRNEYRD